MKRLAIYIIGVIVLFAVCDFTAGIFLSRYLDKHTLGGDCASIDYMLRRADEDVIIVGNSHVLNSLMPAVISDSIGLSVYNGGSNGQNLTFFHSMIDGLLQRHTPKAIILGLDDDVLSRTGRGERYNILTPYYGRGYEMIDSCLSCEGKHEKLLMHSTFYRYNTIWWRMLLYTIVKDKEHTADGFISKPLPPKAPVLHHKSDDCRVDEDRIRELDDILSLCRSRNIKVVVVFTPLYENRTGSRPATERMRMLENKYDNLRYIDDTSDSLFLSRPDLFFDNGHLNIEGAKIYSSQKASQLKDILTE